MQHYKFEIVPRSQRLSRVGNLAGNGMKGSQRTLFLSCGNERVESLDADREMNLFLFQS
jgi:hypothetical protein